MSCICVSYLLYQKIRKNRLAHEAQFIAVYWVGMHVDEASEQAPCALVHLTLLPYSRI